MAALEYYLRTSLHRKHFGLGNPALHCVSHVGTKKLIETYIAQVCQGLDALVDEVEDAAAAAQQRQQVVVWRRRRQFLWGGAERGAAAAGRSAG